MSHHRLHTDASTSAINGTHPASEERPSLRPGRAQTARSWPLLVLALPATVAVWSGWVGIGQMTGFGQVYPLPGIFNSLHLDTAVTLPVGVEAYAAYALRAWLSASTVVPAPTRRFAPPPPRPVPPPVRDQLADSGHGRAGRLPPPHPSRGQPRTMGHHHRRVLPAGPGPGHGRRPRPPPPRRRAQPAPAGARRTGAGGGPQLPLRRPCCCRDTA